MKNIIVALNNIMKKVGYVQKKDRNAFHNYKYASEASLLDALRPALIEEGLVLIPSGKSISDIDSNGNTHLEMEYTLAHISGEVWPDKIIAFGSGNDRAKNGNVGDKGTYKAITGANKYLLFKLFQIETGDDPEIDNGTPHDTTKAGVDDIPLGGGWDKKGEQLANKAKANEPVVANPKLISEPQKKRMFAIAKGNGWPDADVKILIGRHGFDSSKDITKDEYEKIVKQLEVKFSEV